MAYLSKLDSYRRDIMGIQDEELKNYAQILRASNSLIALPYVGRSHETDSGIGIHTNSVYEID